MIISHKYRFIFIKTRKTAGTSIEIALSKFCGDDDVITPQVAEDEQIRRDKGYRTAQNYYVPYSGYSLKHWRRLFLKGIRATYKRHTPASFVHGHLDREIWDSYFKFCVERNPWDKAISLYYWRLGMEETGEKPSLSQYLSQDLRRLSNWYIYAMDGKPAVDQIIPYENLNDELDRIAEKLGLPEKLDLPRAKGGFRTDKRSYRDVIDSETKSLVDRVCAREIAYFGYLFDS